MIFCAADPMEEDAEEPNEAEEAKAMEVDEIEERDQMGSAFFLPSGTACAEQFGDDIPIFCPL